jgi:hypothetical protein
MPAKRVHNPQALPNARCVPPSGFGYPRGGLLPSTPGRASFISTAFLGFPPAELSPPGRWVGVSPKRRSHMPVWRRLTPARRSAPAGHRNHQLLGFGPPPESHDPPRVFSQRRTGCSLGVLPFQGSAAGRLADGLSPAGSPYALRRGRRSGIGWRLRVSISDRLAQLVSTRASPSGVS